MPHLLRVLLKERALFRAGVASLALAVGANTAIFSVVNALWLRPLAVGDADRVFVPHRRVATSLDGSQIDNLPARSRLALADLDAFSAVTFELSVTGPVGRQWQPVVLRASDEPALRVAAVAYNYFDVLRVRLQGRGFHPVEDAPGASPVAVISDRFWRRAFGADPQTVGSVLTTTASPVTIVGIAAPGFHGPRLTDEIDLWMPLAALPHFSGVAAEAGDEFMPLTVLARLREDTSIEAAQAQLTSILGSSVVLRPLRHLAFAYQSEGDVARQGVLLRSLWITATLVLLLGCANLAALLLARAERRRYEFAVRLHVGATRSSLAGLVLSEALVIGVVGLAAGLWLRWWLLSTVQSLQLPTAVAVADLDLSLEPRIALFGAVVAVGCVGMSAAAAVRLATRADVSWVHSRSAATLRTGRLAVRNVLLAAQVALSIVLVVGAVTLVAFVTSSFRQNPGFASEHVLFIEIHPRFSQYVLPTGSHDRERHRADYVGFIERLRNLPGVVEATWGASLLYVTERPRRAVIHADGESHSMTVAFRAGGPRYLRALGVELVAGRDLEDTDARSAVDRVAVIAWRLGAAPPPPADRGRPAAVVDTTLVQGLWGRQSALGRLFTWDSVAYEVVGIMPPIEHDTWGRQPVPTVITFNRLGTNLSSPLFVVLRSNRPAQQLIHSVEAVARDAFPNPAFLASRTAHDILADRIAGERVGAVLFSWYGATAVLLGLAGIYGLTSYLMARNWRELGVRSALGASTGTLAWMTISRALAPVVLGIAVGIGLAVVASQALTATVLGLEGADAFAYAASGGGFLVAALVASIVAALPVWHLNPSDVLRSE